MSNYLQSPNVQFSQYIPPVDPNLYGRALMYKQQQYDQGVERVQSYIDSVAGIEVVKPIHKEYLNSKLSDISTQVKSMASKDFSNNQLVGQIGSLTSSVAKDSVIQNAMMATMNYKKNLAALEKDKAEGKSSVENEWDFKNNFNKWVSDNNLNSSFNYTYTPYRDVRKKALDIFKTLDPTITEQDFTLDETGNVVFGGDVIQRVKTKGISPQQIKSALYAGLDSSDLNQLAISGRYSYANADAFKLAESININYNSTKNSLENKLALLEDRQKNASNGFEASKLENEIYNLKKALETNNTNSKRLSSLIASGDLDTVKSQLYTNNFFDQFSNAFTYTETNSSYENNPFFNVRMEKANLELKAREAIAKAKKAENFTESFVIDSANNNEMTHVNMSNFSDKIITEKANLTKEKNSTLTALGHSGDEKWLDEQRILYNTSKFESIPNRLRKYFELEELKEKEIKTNEQLLTKLDEEADAAGFTLGNTIPTDIEPLRFSVAGTVYNFTPEEIVNFNKKVEDVRNTASQSFVNAEIGGVPTLGPQAIKNNSNFSNKERLLFSLYTKSTKNNIEKEIENTINTLNKKVNSKEPFLIQKRNEYINNRLGERTLESFRSSYELPVGEAKLRSSVRNKVNNVLDAIEQQGSVGTDTRRFNLEDARKINLDNAATYSLTVKPETIFGESKYWLKIQRGDEETQEIPLNLTQKRAIFAGAYEQSMPKLEQAIAITGNGSTNFEGTSDIEKSLINPYLTQNDFPKVSQYSIRGDIEDIYGEYNPIFYIWDPVNKKTVRKEIKNPGGTLFTEEAIQNLLQNGITDDYIYQLLYTDNNTPPTEEQKNQIKQINNNPF